MSLSQSFTRFWCSTLQPALHKACVTLSRSSRHATWIGVSPVCHNHNTIIIITRIIAAYWPVKHSKLEMWANAQSDGRPAEYRWRPLLNAAVWLTRTTRVPCSNAAKTRNPLKLAGMPQTNETISAAGRPKFTILWGHLEEILLLNKFFSDCRYVP